MTTTILQTREVRVPSESYGRLFLRFLRFGLLAWGGPVAQIAMIRQELVEEEKWITRERFNRVLAVYQALPGPEAHELCVYFGMLAGGRIGAVLAGLGFMLPGFMLMLALSWFYGTYGLAWPLFGVIFRGFQAAVGALIVRAVQRIGQHALRDRYLWGIALSAGAATWLGANFILVLLLAGVAYMLCKRGQRWAAVALGVTLLGFAASGWLNPLPIASPSTNTSSSLLAPSLLTLFITGLRSGLLTFGGAYTAIPIMQADATWLTTTQFLDGIALSGILPAPLIIFSTFVGYMGGGWVGALLLTAGVFLPAFAFTLIGHDFFERLVENTTTHDFLDGITAGVVGLIAATAINLLLTTITAWQSLLICGIAFIVLWRAKTKWATMIVVLGAGMLGWVLFR